jgi:hypothetical protein
MNRMHGRYQISNEDYVYVLSALILEPLRWNSRFGWRPYTEKEKLAHLVFWREIGRRMGIRELPVTLAETERFNVDYERERFRYAGSNRVVAEATMRVFLAWYPAPLRPLVRLFICSLLESRVLQAFDYREPPAPVRGLVLGALGLRARLLRHLPRRRRPHLLTLSATRTYPSGYSVQELGVLAPRQD